MFWVRSLQQGLQKAAVKWESCCTGIHTKGVGLLVLPSVPPAALLCMHACIENIATATLFKVTSVKYTRNAYLRQHSKDNLCIARR